MDALTSPASSVVPPSAMPTPAPATPVKAVTQAPVSAEPDPYVWMPADNPLLGQTPRQTKAPPLKTDVIEAKADRMPSWQWRETQLGLGVGAAIGVALGAIAFRAFASVKG